MHNRLANGCQRLSFLLLKYHSVQIITVKVTEIQLAHLPLTAVWNTLTFPILLMQKLVQQNYIPNYNN